MLPKTCRENAARLRYAFGFYRKMRLYSTSRFLDEDMNKMPSWFKQATMSNDAKLPRLPIPSLQDTMDRYLASIQPLLQDEKEFKMYQALAKDFISNEGSILQASLVKKEQNASANPTPYPLNYTEEDWYANWLAPRYEIAIKRNPSYNLIEEQETHLKEMIPRTAAFVHSLLKWWIKVKTGLLDIEKNQCMHALPRQFGTVRLPGIHYDTIRTFPESKHIVILKDNVFYKLQVFSSDEQQQISKASLGKTLTKLLNETTQDLDISSLTALRRDKWAKVRKKIETIDSVNAKSLELIDSALFILVLDPRQPKDTSERCALTLHGNGKLRWYDKLQIVAYADGNLGSNVEHSFSDGMAWNRWHHEAWHDMRGTDSGFTPLPQLHDMHHSNVEQLKWKLSPDYIDEIHQAQEDLDRRVDDTDTKYFEFETYGKQACKKWKVSPDGIAQMALQLAFYKANHHVPLTWESCSTRTFLHGRTDTIRSATATSTDFVKAVQSSAPISIQRENLLKAVRNHVEVALSTQRGHGFDRHLLVLKSIATEHGIQSTFLQSPQHEFGMTYEFATSNVTLPCLQDLTFGPVADHGMSVGYLIHNNSIALSMTKYKSQPLASTSIFTAQLQESLKIIKQILDGL